MANLGREISEQYDITVQNIIPARDEYILNTSGGKKILKKTVLRPERIHFIHEAKEHIYANGFTNIDRFIQTGSNKPYILIDQEYYTLADMIEGEEYVLNGEKKLCRAAELIALMHRASSGFTPSEGCLVKKELGKLPMYFEKRLKELKRLKKLAECRKTFFDIVFMEHVDYFYSLGDKALERLIKSNYDALVKEAESERLICHNSFSSRSIVQSNNTLYLINFDQCCFELKLFDIAGLLKSAQKACKCTPSCTRGILDSYRAVNDINDDEVEIIRILLLFPYKFWRVSNRYYNCKSILMQGNYAERLREAISETACQTELALAL